MKILIFFLMCSDFLFAATNPKPWVIGHRGASGYRPEHTLESYKLAINQGADFIEPDLVVTKDKVLIVRHEPELSLTTDVAEKFPNRKKSKTIDGKNIEGWFAEDFTLKEIKSLRAKERFPTRDQSFNGKFLIPTFEDVIELVQKENRTGKIIGLIPEIKHPTYFRNQGIPLEPLVAGALKKHNLATAAANIYVQSFELESLKELKKLIPVKTVFLVYQPESLASGMSELAKWVTAIGPHKSMIVPVKDGQLGAPTSLVRDAKKVGLEVYVYTFRSDKEHLPAAYRGKPEAEYRQFYNLGVDGVFSDFPDVAVSARKLSED